MENNKIDNLEKDNIHLWDISNIFLLLRRDKKTKLQVVEVLNRFGILIC